jgi:hypothetical protein
MRQFSFGSIMLALLALPVLGETFHNVAIVDKNYAGKVAGNPDAHTRDCVLKCASSGYGILTNDQKFLKFDADGNPKLKQALQASDRKDHLRVDVSGDVENNTLKVKFVKRL